MWEITEFPFFKVLIDQCWKVSKVTFAFLTKTKTKDFWNGWKATPQLWRKYSHGPWGSWTANLTMAVSHPSLLAGSGAVMLWVSGDGLGASLGNSKLQFTAHSLKADPCPLALTSEMACLLNHGQCSHRSISQKWRQTAQLLGIFMVVFFVAITHLFS